MQPRNGRDGHGRVRVRDELREQKVMARDIDAAAGLRIGEDGT